MREVWRTFDDAAAGYRAVRPCYPDEVFDAIETYLGRSPRGLTAIEIGIGTGQATRELAARGWRVCGLEPASNLFELARQDFADVDGVALEMTTFEAADIAEDSADLVAAATSWHWVDPSIGFRKARQVLRNDGVIALWWNAHVSDTTDSRWAPLREVYRRVAPELATLPPLAPERFDYDPAAEMVDSHAFDHVEEQRYAFEQQYTTPEFLTLIDTYASHQRLDPPRRRMLRERLAESIESNLSGMVTKPYEALLVLGRPSGCERLNRTCAHFEGAALNCRHP